MESLHSIQNPSLASKVDFAPAATRALERLRNAAHGLIRTAPVAVERAVDLHRALGVEASLGWNIFRLAGAADPLGAIAYIPKSGLMEKFIRVADERGFDAEAVRELDAAYTEFERLVEQRAGDRDAFDAMVAALGGESAEQVGVKHRRTAFRANALLWGVEAKTLYRCGVYHFDEDARTGLTYTGGVLGLRQLRQVPALPFTRFLKHQPQLEHANVVPTNMKLLEEFCSQPLPRVHFEEDEAGAYEEVQLVLDGVGRASKIDCFFSLEMIRNGEPHLAMNNAIASFISVPAEEVVIDLLISRGWTDPESVCSQTHGNVGAIDRAATRQEKYLMPATETASYLGTSIEALGHKSMPKAVKMIRSVLRQHGWLKEEFDLYRCRVRFPILHSAVSIQVKTRESVVDKLVDKK